MPRRQSKRRTSKTQSTHFTAARIHQLRRKAKAGSSIVGKPLAQEFIRLAVHLCQRCESCWEVVDQLAPCLRPHCCDPVTDGIVFLGDPRSWIALKEDQRLSLRQVRERAYGFAHVVIDTAMTHANTRGMVTAGISASPSATSTANLLVDTDEVMFWAIGLIADLTEQTEKSDSPEVGDLFVYLSCRLTELRLSQPGGLPVALELLRSIHSALKGSTRQPYLLVGVHELELRIYSDARRYEEADESYRKALDLLGPEQALYRFDVHSVATEALFQRQAPPEQRYVTFSTALAELPTDAEPFDRLCISHSLARATRSLARLAYAEGLPAWPGIREALEVLEQARPLHREYGDSFSLEMADTYRKDLEYLATKLTSIHTH